MRLHKQSVNSIFRFVLLTVLIASLSACGFKLRGAYQLPETLQKIYVQGSTSSDLVKELKEILGYSAVVVAKRSEASAVLNIIKEELERRTLSVDSRGKIREAELQYSVIFSVIDSDGVLLLEKETVMLERDYIDDENDVIGRSNEAGIITRDLKRDAAQRIVRRLQAIKPIVSAN